MTGLLVVAGALAQDYRFPTSTEDYEHYYPTAYKDHDGVDWNCGDIRYSGHQGSDFGGGSWSGMDAGRDIVAAAVGVVTETNDGEFDACTSGDCSGGGGYGNYVRIQHPDGKETLYAHLRKHTVAVAVGQHVQCGEKLGEMGSSGYSTGPHLHFAVKGLSGSYEDPFDGPCSGAPSYWVEQGDYDDLPGLQCDTPAACQPVTRLSCGGTHTQRSDGEGATEAHAFYGCTDWLYTGPEVAVEFATDLDEPVSVRLTGLSADLDLYVLGSSDCQAGDCLGASDGSDTSDEAVEFTATAGAVYTVVVDGYDGAVSDFTLSFSCDGALPVEDTGEPDEADTGGTPRDSGTPQDAPGAVASPGGCGCAGGGSGGLLAAILAWAMLTRRSAAPTARARSLPPV